MEESYREPKVRTNLSMLASGKITYDITVRADTREEALRELEDLKKEMDRIVTTHNNAIGK